MFVVVFLLDDVTGNRYIQLFGLRYDHILQKKICIFHLLSPFRLFFLICLQQDKTATATWKKGKELFKDIVC